MNSPSQIDFVHLADCIFLQSDLQDFFRKSRRSHASLSDDEWDESCRKEVVMWWMSERGYDEQVIKILVDLI